ncbi:hypothetical protein BGZ47_002509 [Haplosporangium gracile]|nr:hypothetical protein BGZ47_002509 [Haplosporangium gracile]
MAAVTSGTLVSFLAHSIKPQQLSSQTKSATTCQFRHINILSSYVSRNSFHSTALRSKPLSQQKITPLSSYTCHQSTLQLFSTSLSVSYRRLTTVCQGQSRGLSGFSGFGGGQGGDSGKNSNLPPSSKWDMPARTSDTSATAPPSLLKRPIVPTPRTWDSLKGAQAAAPVSVEDSQANIKLNLKKLNAISSVTKKKQAYSPYLLITQLPSTVMPDDIRRLADSKESIKDIIFHRNQFMEFQNKVTVVFRSATDAVDFITQKYGKFLGGHKLNMTMLDPYNPRDKRSIPPNLRSEPFSGHLVLISGLPAASRPDHLRTEFRRFQLMDTTEAAIIPVPSKRMASSCQYLIRLSSRSEAYRFVRTYHNTFFQYKEFRKRCPIRTTIIY